MPFIGGSLRQRVCGPYAVPRAKGFLSAVGAARRRRRGPCCLPRRRRRLPRPGRLLQGRRRPLPVHEPPVRLSQRRAVLARLLLPEHRGGAGPGAEHNVEPPPYAERPPASKKSAAAAPKGWQTARSARPGRRPDSRRSLLSRLRPAGRTRTPGGRQAAFLLRQGVAFPIRPRERPPLGGRLGGARLPRTRHALDHLRRGDGAAGRPRLAAVRPARRMAGAAARKSSPPVAHPSRPAPPLHSLLKSP